MLALFTKAFELLTAEDIAAIIGWPESLTVEFKKALSARDGREDNWISGGKIEQYALDKLFKEIVAFANTSGGHLLLGIAETEEAPPIAANLVPVPRCVDLGERLARAAQSIDSPIPLLLIRGIPTAGDAGVVVFRVPASRAAPHRSTDKESYVRRNTESVPMSMREIQDMTLASGRREEFTETRFKQAAHQFSKWFNTSLRKQFQAGGFRITAVPIGAHFELGRIFGREGLIRQQRDYQVTINSNPMKASAIIMPERSRPIVRGVRWTYDNEGESVYFDIHSNGVITFGFRVPPREQGEHSICLGWIIAYFTNVLCTADQLRRVAGVPDCEYGIEFELRSNPLSNPIKLRNSSNLWPTEIGESLHDIPLILPRVSFGYVSEINNIINIIVNDLCDATGAYHAQPLSLNIDISSML